MLISVIVPVYNVEKYLNQCLKSLQCQSFKELEVIMVDDGSTDTSGEICDWYADKYNNFKVIHKSNQGLGMARNTGLKYSNGEYVIFMDADDYLDRSSIENLYREIIRHKADMCKGGFRRVSEDGTILAVKSYQNESFEGDEFKRDLFPRMIGSSPSKQDAVEMCVCGTIYRAGPIKKFGLRFPSEREMISEDLVFNMDYAQHANGACLIADTGYNYRVTPASLTTSYREDRFEASRYFYLEMRKRCIGMGYDKNVLQRLDKMFFVKVRVSISQEKTASGKEHDAKESMKIIEKICSDATLRKVIADYPIGQLGFKQKFFLKLIQMKSKRLLFLLAEVGVL